MTDDLNTMLRRHGQAWQDDFTPPPLAPVLKTATAPSHSRRWLPALVAAVLILAIPIATVIAVHHTRTASPATSQVFAVPRTIQQNGQTLQRSTDLAWNDAVISADGKQVTVQASVGEPTCDAGVIRGFVTGQSAQAISITVSTYVKTGSDSCIAFAPGPHAVSVSLDNALGNRTLTDDRDGAVHPPLNEQTMPRLTYLPSGYRQLSLTWDETPQNQRAVRTYSPGYYKGIAAPPTLSVARQELTARARGPFGANSASGTDRVLGHPASVVASAGPSSELCVNWLDPTYGWSVCLSGNLATEAKLLKIANSLR